jgi:UDP-N-acetylglucosamine 4,6-dehydratase
MRINEKSSILVTGGTGSFGKKFVELILQKFPNIQRLVIYSRDELKQFESFLTINTQESAILLAIFAMYDV